MIGSNWIHLKIINSLPVLLLKNWGITTSNLPGEKPSSKLSLNKLNHLAPTKPTKRSRNLYVSLYIAEWSGQSKVSGGERIGGEGQKGVKCKE